MSELTEGDAMNLSRSTRLYLKKLEERLGITQQEVIERAVLAFYQAEFRQEVTRKSRRTTDLMSRAKKAAQNAKKDAGG